VLRDLVMVQRAAKAQYGDAAAGDESDTDDDDDNSDELEEPDRGQPYPMGVGRGCVVVPRAAGESGGLCHLFSVCCFIVRSLLPPQTLRLEPL
ncbi:hypothetical protein V5799_026473, partial [Amblyomma americanum]